MHSVEFKAEIVDGIITVPPEYKDFQNAYVLLTLTMQDDARKTPKTRLKDNMQSLDFSQCSVNCFQDINPVDYQRKIRDAKQ